MAKVELSSENFGLKLYNRFPPKYREDDVEQRYALKRYLEALSDGGFKYAIDEINGITNLIDPRYSPVDVLLALFEQYGLYLFNGIPELYLRFLFPNLGEIYSRKGSMEAIVYITSVISGVNTSVLIDYDDDNPIITVKLDMDSAITEYFPDSEQMNKILVNFLPFYCDKILVYTFYIEEHGSLHSIEESTSTIYTLPEDNAVFDHAIMGKAVFNKVDHAVEELPY